MMAGYFKNSPECPIFNVRAITAYTKKDCRCSVCRPWFNASAAASQRERRLDPEIRDRINARNRNDRRRAHAREYRRKLRRDPESLALIKSQSAEWRRTWRGWASTAISNARKRTKWYELPGCTLTIDDVLALVPVDEMCPVLGIKLEIGPENKDSSPSLEQVRPRGGYTPENTRIISLRANRILDNATPAELLACAAWREREQGAEA